MSRPVRSSYEFGPFCLDLSEHRLLRDGRPLPLTPKHFDVLRVLVQNSGHLVEKERLLKEVWPDSYVEEGALNRSVSVLRKTLGENASEQKYIETVPKLGYRFVAPVTVPFHEHPSSIVETKNDAAVDVETASPGSRPLPMLASESRSPSSRAGFLLRAASIAGVALMVGALSYTVLEPGETAKVSPTLAPAHRQVTFTGTEGDPTLSPDGKRIAYVSEGAPERKLMVQELAGGQPHEVFRAPEVGHLRWSPDGTELMLWARGSGYDGIYIMPESGGSARRVARGQFLGCWSPDGSTIAVGTYLGGKIWFLDTSGREQRTVSLQGVHWSIWAIDWSPANGLLTLVSNDYQERYTIWTVEPDGSDQTSVLTEAHEIPSARWSPQGDAIYYLRRLNQTNSLYKAFVQFGHDNLDAVPTPLITGLETDRSFALSADGHRLVYARAPYYSNLWILEARPHGESLGTEARALTEGTSLIERPRVSPDGTAIVFNVGHEPVTNLYTMPITGGAPKQLTFRDSLNVGGVWSADGTQIAFASTEGGKPRVWSVDAGGGVPRALSSGDLSDSLDLAWSSGAHILYQRAGNRNYYLLDPETKEERLLANDASRGWMFSPVYSPDGQKIAVLWNRPPNRGLWVIDTRNSQETLVYRTSAGSVLPVAWSSNGRSVYVLEGKPSTYRGPTLPLGETVTDARILMVSVKDGRVKTIASLPFEEIGAVSMTPDGRRLVFTVYTSRSDVWVVDNFDVSTEPRLARQ